jgi:hypothetical protein
VSRIQTWVDTKYRRKDAMLHMLSTRFQPSTVEYSGTVRYTEYCFHCTQYSLSRRRWSWKHCYTCMDKDVASNPSTVVHICDGFLLRGSIWVYGRKGRGLKPSARCGVSGAIRRALGGWPPAKLLDLLAFSLSR